MKIHRYLVATLVALLLSSATVFAADPTGTWTWTRQGRDGQSFEVTARLQFTESKLTGTVTGFQGAENPISDGKLEGDQISFNVVVNFNGNEIKFAYQGKLDGDSITGTITWPGRDGDTRTSDWKATRKKV
jgi:hypothetical protein